MGSTPLDLSNINFGENWGRFVEKWDGPTFQFSGVFDCAIDRTISYTPIEEGNPAAGILISGRQPAEVKALIGAAGANLACFNVSVED